MRVRVRVRVRDMVRVSPSLLPPSYHQVGSAEERAMLLERLRALKGK